MSDKNHILLVEDELPIVELVKHTFRSAECHFSAVHTARDAWNFIATRSPHLVLLDWMLPDESGLSLLTRLRAEQKYSQLSIIMLTARGLEEDKIAGLNRGADDYMTKPFSPKELIARVNAMLRRKMPERSHDMMTIAQVTLDPANFTVNVDKCKIEIGHAEFKLLKFFMAHPDRVFSRSQLLDKVWGNHAVIEERTVDVHVLRLRRALGDANYLIQTVRSIGYRLSDYRSAP